MMRPNLSRFFVERKASVKPLPGALACLLLVLLATSSMLVSQTLDSPTGQRPSRITEEIDSTRLVTLKGHVRKDLTAERDLGAVEDGAAFRLYLVLQRSSDQQSALDNLIARQQQPTAPEYHKWLTPQAYGARYGASPQDIAKITAWLGSQGLHVNGVMNSAMLVDFSATAGQLRDVFHTHLHYYNIQGGKYAANADDPMVPAALAPVVAGIQGLSKIPPHSNHSGVSVVRSASDAKASPAFTYNNHGQIDYVVTPQDLYTIYNVNPVFNVNGGVGNGVAEEVAR